MRTCAASSHRIPSVPKSGNCATTWFASRDLLDALADPARQDLVQVLAREELNVGDIASRVTLSRPTVSHHLLILKRAGLVRTPKQGREVYYRLNKAPIVNTLQGLVDSLTCC